MCVCVCVCVRVRACVCVCFKKYTEKDQNILVENILKQIYFETYFIGIFIYFEVFKNIYN